MIVKLECTSCEIRLCIFYIYLPFRNKGILKLFKCELNDSCTLIKQEFLQISDVDLFLHIHLLCVIWFTAFFVCKNNETSLRNGM